MLCIGQCYALCYVLCIGNMSCVIQCNALVSLFSGRSPAVTGPSRHLAVLLHCNALNYTRFVRCVQLEPKLLRPGLFSVRLVFCLAGSVGVQCAVFFAQCPVCRILYLVFSAVFTVLCLCSVCRGSLSCQHIPERDGLPGLPCPPPILNVLSPLSLCS